MAKRHSMAALYAAGERGRNRIRLLADPRTGVLQLEYRCEQGRKARTSCKTRDLAAGKEMADALAAQLASGARHTGRRPLTLRALFDRHDAELGPAQMPRKREQDRHAARNLCAILGATARAAALTPADARRYFAERRRRGDQRTSQRRALGTRAAAYELKYLKAALAWAVSEGELARSTLDGFTVPSEKNPRRPVLRAGQYAALLAVADRVHEYCRTLLVLAHETGHRIGALLALQWEDVDTRARLVRWRAAADKARREHTTPLSAAAVDALDARAAAVLAAGRTTQGLAFPAGRGGPLRRELATQWWQRMERFAGLPAEPGRGWHAVRRQFASELATTVPLGALARLGGWQDHTTLAKCYVLPDAEQLREALERRPELRA